MDIDSKWKSFQDYKESLNKKYKKRLKNVFSKSKSINIKILNNKEVLKLDEISNHSIRANMLKNKLVRISNIIKDLKK